MMSWMMAPLPCWVTRCLCRQVRRHLLSFVNKPSDLLGYFPLCNQARPPEGFYTRLQLYLHYITWLTAIEAQKFQAWIGRRQLPEKLLIKSVEYAQVVLLHCCLEVEAHVLNC